VPVHLHRRFSPFLALRLLNVGRDAVFHFSPLQARLCILARSWSKLSFHGCAHLCVIGSASIDNATVQGFCSKGLDVLRNYGLTEAGPYVLSRLTSAEDFESLDLEHMGEISPGLEERYLPLFDQAFRLQLRRDAVFAGYWNGTARSASDWFDTGDILSLADDGRRKLYLGRERDRWELEGQTVFSDCLERSLLENFPGIAECRVDGPRAGETLTVVACGKGAEPAVVAIPSVVRNSTGLRNLPVHVKLQDRLARTRSGKILRSADQ
jgi:acyl-CoA synthetase (AMP-forming)/AMP-acid ligase II